MGTRADFYVGRGEDAVWLGSIAWDGYPNGITPHIEETEVLWPGASPSNKDGEWPEGASLFEATTEADYRDRLTRFFQYRDDITLADQGWPWPWNTSHTTDFAYAFDNGTVWVSCFGDEWQRASEYQSDEEEERPRTAVFPDMSAVKATTFGPRSGLMIFRGQP